MNIHDPTIPGELLRGPEKLGSILNLRKNTVNISSDNAYRILVKREEQDLIEQKRIHRFTTMEGVAANSDWFANAAGMRMPEYKPLVDADKIYASANGQFIDGITEDDEYSPISKQGSAIINAKAEIAKIYELKDNNFTLAA